MNELVYMIAAISFHISAAKICSDLIEPLVPQMDRDATMDPSIVQALFENGVSGLHYL